MRSTVGDQLFEVASKSRIVKTGRFMAQVQEINGPPQTFGALLRVGKRVE